VLKPLGDKAVIENELEGFGIRLNKKPPNIVSDGHNPAIVAKRSRKLMSHLQHQQLIKKKDKGGIAISNTVPLTKLEEPEIKAVLAEYKMSNCDVSFRCDATLDEVSATICISKLSEKSADEFLYLARSLSMSLKATGFTCLACKRLPCLYRLRLEPHADLPATVTSSTRSMLVRQPVFVVQAGRT
jgi:ribosome-interacting GTPase 1